ncbi:hypothetical protein SEA_KLEIN_62 [Mycobacterium phage Klein]|nr:hypothetical protein SEA_KLEIN_62 [Mycobacterium phage Klein]
MRFFFEGTEITEAEAHQDR